MQSLILKNWRNESTQSQTDVLAVHGDALNQADPQRALADKLVEAVGVARALEFARDRQWFGIIGYIHRH